MRLNSHNIGSKIWRTTLNLERNRWKSTKKHFFMIVYQEGLQSIEASQKLPVPVVHYKASGESNFSWIIFAGNGRKRGIITESYWK